MIAVDANILIYAARQECPYHRQSVRLITSLTEQKETWCIPWPCIYEFVRMVTHAKVFSPPGTIEQALNNLAQLRESPSLTMLGDGPGHARHMSAAIREAGATGNIVHDAHIAALCMEHGVSELYTMDRDFSRFPGLRVTRPFAGPDARS